MTEEQIARLSANEVACYRWPDDTEEHKALRRAFIDGAAHTVVHLPPIAGMVSGPYKYDGDLHPCFRLVMPEGRLIACVYATDTIEQAEADAELFAGAILKRS